MALYCANPYTNDRALGMFNPALATRADLQPNGPTMMLAGTRMDLGLKVYPVGVAAAAAGGSFAGFGNVGTDISNVIGAVAGGASNIIDSLTGRGAARDQAAAAARVAELQAQARTAEAQSSTELWGRALPAIAIAGAAALALGLVVVLKK